MNTGCKIVLITSPLQMTKAPARAGAFVGGLDGSLLQRGRNRREGGVQASAHRLNHSDDRHGDAGGDETVFDGGCARLVSNEMYDHRHKKLPHSEYRDGYRPPVRSSRDGRLKLDVTNRSIFS